MQVHFVAVKVGVVGLTDAFIEAEGPVWTDFDAMGEDREFVERRLAVEEYDVAVSDVSIDDIANPEFFCKLDAVGIFDGPDIRRESRKILLFGTI